MSKPLTEQQLLVGKRRKARHYAMQALYQWKMSGSSLNKIDTEFRTDNDFSKVDGEYFGELLHNVPSSCGTLDTMIESGLTDRTLDEINPVELALLRMSAYELQARLDVPYKVVINEAVSLGKKFGATDSHKFINAVLDKVAAQCRGPEVQAGEQ